METNQDKMDQEIQKLDELLKNEIKEIRNKYNKLKRAVRKKYSNKKPKKSKIKRKTIPKKLKNMIWDKNIGKKFGIGKCYCCSEEIDSKNFEAGHIISVKNGGETTLDNLKPICSCCNKSMGVENLEDFKQKYMKKKGIEDNVYNLLVTPSHNTFSTNDHSFRRNPGNILNRNIITDQDIHNAYYNTGHRLGFM